MKKSKRIISFFIMFICLIGLIVLGTNKVNAEEEIYEIKSKVKLKDRPYFFK